MRFKNAKYTFACNEDIREEFKMLCKISNMSPSEILQGAMLEFNDNIKRISSMQDISEVRALLQEKMEVVDKEMQEIEQHSTFKK